MIYPNKPATDFKYRIEMDSTYDRVGPEEQTIEAALNILYGVELNPGVHGISVILRNYAEYSGSYRHQVLLLFPWGSGSAMPLNLPTFKENLKLEILLTNAKVITDCSEWQFTADLFEVKFWNSTSSAWDIIYTKTNISDSGSGFQTKYCVPKAYNIASINPAVVYTFPGCRVFPENQLSRLESEAVFGWKIKESGSFVSKPINLKLDQILPNPIAPSGCPVCDCQYPLPSIEVDPIEESWKVTLHAKSQQKLELGPTVTVSCSCICPGPPPVYCGIPYVYTIQEEKTEYYDQHTIIRMAPSDAELFQLTEITRAKCWCRAAGEPPFEEISNTNSYPTVYAETYQQTAYLLGKINCNRGSSMGSCPPALIGQPAPLPPEEGCGALTASGCAYRAIRELQWPDSLCECKSPSIDAHRTGAVALACTNGTRVLVKAKHHPNMEWFHSTIVSGIETASPCIKFLPNSFLILTYKNGYGNIVLRYSYDLGRTFTPEITYFEGASMPRLAVNEFGDILLASIQGGKIRGRFQGAGDTDFGTPFYFKDSTNTDIEIESNQHFDIRYSYGTSAPLIGTWVIKDASTAYTWYSFDDGKTWRKFE